MTKGEILDKTHWNFVTEKGISSIHGQTFPSAYKEQAEIAMDEYYNQAIDAALIEVYEKKRIYKSIYRADKSLAKMELLCDELIAKLEALKKKP